MNKWITYLCILFALIVITVVLIAGSGASFIHGEENMDTYKAYTIAEKYSRTFYDHEEPIKPFPLSAEKLPTDLKWESNLGAATFTDPRATKGGTLHSWISSYPKTFRRIGPNSNGSFRDVLYDSNSMDLIEEHPFTLEPVQSMACAWAVGHDKRTVYYRLDPDAAWSDGVPITTDDFIYMLKMLRAPGVVAPWYNTYYSEQVEDILKFDDHVMAIRLPVAKPSIVFAASLRPEPYHYYGNLQTKEEQKTASAAYAIYHRDHCDIPEILAPCAKLSEVKTAIQKASDAELTPLRKQAEELEQVIAILDEAGKKYTVTIEDVSDNWTKKYAWGIPPTTGAYTIDSYMHGKWIRLRRIKNWWAKDKKYTQYRYNADFKLYKVIADLNIAYEYFRQHELDTFPLTDAKYWHKKAYNMQAWKDGYVIKNIYWRDYPCPSRMISMNMMNEEQPALKDINVRLGIAYSLNFQKMIDLAMLGDAEQASSITTGCGDYCNTELKPRAFDIDKAGEYFDKAGYNKRDTAGYRINAQGERLSFKLTYAHDLYKDRILILKEEARKAGLELVPDTFDPTSVFASMLNKEHELAWHAWGAGTKLYGAQYWGQYHSQNAGKKQNNNFSNTADPDLDLMIDRYRLSTSLKERQKLAHNIQSVVNNQCAAIPTYYVPFLRMAYWRWIKIPEIAEAPNAETLLTYGTYWIDEKAKKETLDAMKEGKTFPRQTIEFDTYRPGEE